jgi:hypothetical protein
MIVQPPIAIGMTNEKQILKTWRPSSSFHTSPSVALPQVFFFE